MGGIKLSENLILRGKGARYFMLNQKNFNFRYIFKSWGSIIFIYFVPIGHIQPHFSKGKITQIPTSYDKIDHNVCKVFS